MNYDRLYQLVDKYLNGMSSVTEEQEIKYYLLHEDIPEDLMPLKSQFLAYQKSAKSTLNETFEQNFWELVARKDELANVENDPREVGFGKHRGLYYTLVGVAATLLILLTVWTTSDVFNIKHTLNNYNNPALAYQQATDALSVLAINFDKGLAQTREVAKPLNTSLKMLDKVGVVNKGMESLQPVAMIDNIGIIKYNNNH